MSSITSQDVPEWMKIHIIRIYSLKLQPDLDFLFLQVTLYHMQHIIQFPNKWTFSQWNNWFHIEISVIKLSLPTVFLSAYFLSSIELSIKIVEKDEFLNLLILKLNEVVDLSSFKFILRWVKPIHSCWILGSQSITSMKGNFSFNEKNSNPSLIFMFCS